MMVSCGNTVICLVAIVKSSITGWVKALPLMGVSCCAMNHLSLYRQEGIQSASHKGICAQFYGGSPGIGRTTPVDL